MASHAAALDGRRLEAVRASAGEHRALGLLRAAGGIPEDLTPLSRDARTERLKQLGFRKVGVRLQIDVALTALAAALDAADADGCPPTSTPASTVAVAALPDDTVSFCPDDTVSFCPGSPWRVVHRLLVCCMPVDDEAATQTSTAGSRPFIIGAIESGTLLRGALFYRGWLKLSPEQHGGGWVKRAHEPFGVLVCCESCGGTEVVPSSDEAAARVVELAAAETLGLAERHELRAMLSDGAARDSRGPPFGTPGRDLSAGLDGARWLLLQPTLGLSNRLRALTSALNLCRVTRRVLLLQWYATSVYINDCYCSYCSRCRQWRYSCYYCYYCHY